MKKFIQGKSNNGRSITAAAFLLGAASGAAAFLLMPPGAARRIRGRLRGGTGQLWKKGEDFVQRQGAALEGAAGAVRRRLENVEERDPAHSGGA